MYGTCFAAPSDQKFNAFVDTEYYTINVPDSWKDDCLCNIADGDGHSYTLTFYDKLSREKNGHGGWLFSIRLLPASEDYTKNPDYDILGSLVVY